MNAARLAALGAALTLGLSTAAIAQPPARTRPARTAADSLRHGRHQGPRGAGAGAVLKGLNLTPAQTDQVKSISKRYAEQRRALMQNTPRPAQDSTARAQLRANAREMQQKQMQEIRGLLTAEQQQAFDANVAKFRERGGARARGFKKG